MPIMFPMFNTARTGLQVCSRLPLPSSLAPSLVATRAAQLQSLLPTATNAAFANAATSAGNTTSGKQERLLQLQLMQLQLTCETSVTPTPETPATAKARNGIICWNTGKGWTCMSKGGNLISSSKGVWYQGIKVKAKKMSRCE